MNGNRSQAPTQLLSINCRADLYYWNAPCNIWFVTLFMYTAATFLSLCTSCSGCTVTLLLLHALLVYVGRSDKKDSCRALYLEEVSSVSIEGTQHCVCIILLILATHLFQAGSYSSSYETLFFNDLRENDHSNSTFWPWLFSQRRRWEWLCRRSELRFLLIYCSLVTFWCRDPTFSPFSLFCPVLVILL